MNVLNRLPKKVVNNINYYADYISNYLNENKIDFSLFLFGSISKFDYNDDSDIDLLLLLEKDYSKRECRDIKIEMLYDLDDKGRELDLKVYSKNHFYSTDNYFENSIQKDLVRLR